MYDVGVIMKRKFPKTHNDEKHQLTIIESLNLSALTTIVEEEKND